MMRSSKTLKKIRVESRKFRCQPQCFANFNVRSTGKPVALTSARQTTLALLKPMNLWGTHGGISSQESWRSYCRKRMNSLSHENLVHKFIPMPQAMKIPDAKAAVEKEQENSRNTSMAADECQKQKRGDRRSKEWGPFCVIDGSLSSQEFGVRASIRAPKWYCERWFRIICSIHWTRIISIIDDGRKSHGHYFKTTGMHKTSSRCSICLYPCQNGRCTEVVEKSVFVYQNTNGLNHGPVWNIQSFLLSEICTVILWQDYYGKSNLRRSYWNMAGRKFQIGNVSLFIVKKDYSYLCMWMT